MKSAIGAGGATTAPAMRQCHRRGRHGGRSGRGSTHVASRPHGVRHEAAGPQAPGDVTTAPSVPGYGVLTLTLKPISPGSLPEALSGVFRVTLQLVGSRKVVVPVLSPAGTVTGSMLRPLQSKLAS